MTPDREFPKYDELMWPTLLALRDLGGSGTIQEINEKVIELEGFSEPQQNRMHGSSGQTELAYRLAWARTWLRGSGAIDSSARAVWALTEKGRSMSEAEMRQAAKEFRAQYDATRKKAADDVVDAPTEETTWKERLIKTLLGVTPAAFERLSQRLLREAGFTNVKITGQTGDGGIDGVGIYRLSLMSFPTFFQCKRHKGSVSSSVIRDFRGAMAGRGDQGLLITTGTFSKDAVAESTRDGAPRIELIDGDRLCDLLKSYKLGVLVSERVVEDVAIHPHFFQEL